MQPRPEDQSRQPGRSRRADRRNSTKEEKARMAVICSSAGDREKQAGGDGDVRRREEEGGGGATKRRAASEGGERTVESEELRWRLNQLQKEKLSLTSSHNQQVCSLQAEVARLRCSLERGEAQRAELQYQLAASRREGERVAELNKDRSSLTERNAELQQTVAELQKALIITQQARREDQQALQQDVDERDELIQNLGSENQRLHKRLQDQEAILEESESKMAELQQERQKEAEVNRRQAAEIKTLAERSCMEKELTHQRVKSLESSVEAERAAHQESKRNLEVLQLRTRDLEAGVVAEQTGQQEALRSLELLRAHLREMERVYSLENERRESTERALERLQAELNLCRSDMTVALETERKATSDLAKRLEEEKGQHGDMQSLLQQAATRQSETEEAFLSALKQIQGVLQPLVRTGQRPTRPARDDGKPSPAVVLELLEATVSSAQKRQEETSSRVQELLESTEKLQEENLRLRRLISDQKKQSDEALLKLQEEVAQLRLQSSDWSAKEKQLQEERMKEKQQRSAEVQEIQEEFRREAAARLSFLHCLYQRLLAGCVLISQPQGILGDFTWQELCDVIGEQVDRLTSDLRRAKDESARLRRTCHQRSVCVRELQRSQECVMARLEESARRREEAVSGLQSQLQVCRSQCDTHRDRAASLERRCSSLTSDLSGSRRDSSRFSLACALLAGALAHSRRCVASLSEQKLLLRRQLAERERLELELQRLADALGGEKTGEAEEEQAWSRSRRRWRRGVCAVLALRRWMAVAKETTLLFQLDRRGGSVSVCLCGDLAMATLKGENDDGPEAAGVRWLRSESLRSAILSSMVDLQGALADMGSSPQSVLSAARSDFSRLLDHLLDQSARGVSSGRRVVENRPATREPDLKPRRGSLVAALQQHFLLFSQRLHSAEVERRSLRLEVAGLKKGLRPDRAEFGHTVPSERFQAACEELRLALSREQEAQTLIQEQTHQVLALQQRAGKLSSEQTDAQRALGQTQQALSRKERSLRILGKHLSAAQKERRRLEERQQRAEEQLRDAVRRRDFVIRCLKAAETSCRQVRESLVRLQDAASSLRRPLLFAQEPLNAIAGSPEAAACQGLLSAVSQLHHAYASRIDGLQQEVSAHRSHVTALRGELQDACLRENLAYVPVEGRPCDLPRLSGSAR